MKTPSDFKDLLKLFNENHVRYLVVGGYAFIHYVEPRYTKDLDVWISPDKTNASAAYKALHEFGAPLTQITEADFNEEEIVYQMGVPPVRVDVLTSIDGVDFEKAWSRRVETIWEEVNVHIVSRDDLIANKRAASRPQDLMDAQMLEKSVQWDEDRLERERSRESVEDSDIDL